MATSFSVTCPECDKGAKATDELVGRKIRCKACGHVYVVKSPGGKSSSVKSGTSKKSGQSKSTAGKEPAKAVSTKVKTKADDKKTALKPPPPPEDEDGDGKPYGITHENLSNRCPECANEMESADAIICLHCGYNTRSRQREQTKKVYAHSGGEIFLWLLPGILCALGFIGLLVFDILYTINIAEWTRNAWCEFLAHGSIVFWLWIGSCFGFFALGRFAVIRLCIKNMPPEVEKAL